MLIADDHPLLVDGLCSLLEAHGMEVVGIDPEAHQALVWSGRKEAAVATADLINIIYGKGSSRK